MSIFGVFKEFLLINDIVINFLNDFLTIRLGTFFFLR